MPMRGKRVLVVEGHQDTREAMVEVMAEMGGCCVQGIDIPSDIVVFVEFVQKFRPDIVVWDIPCPYKEHCGFFAEMYESGGMRQFCFIGITTAKPSTIFEMLGDKLSACFLKPFDWEEMLHAVRHSPCLDE